MATILDYVAFARTYSQNPIATLTKEHFEEKLILKNVFGRKILYVYDEELIKHVFVTNAQNYPLSFVRRIVFDPIMPDGMLVSLGEPWKEARRATAPVFTPKKMEALIARVQKVAQQYAANLASADGETVEITEFMQCLTMEFLVASLFDGCEEFRPEAFIATIRELRRMAGIPHTLDLLSAPRWIPRFGRPDVGPLCQQLRQTAQPLLDHARRVDISDSLMAKVLGLDDVDDRIALDHLLSFLLAGYDTTARAFIWTTYLVSTHEHVRDKVHAEIAALGDRPATPDALPYLQAAIRESMRLYPPVADLSRVAVADDQFGDLHISAGTTINVANFALHRRAEYFDDPEVFRPERFLSPDLLRDRKYSYLPFGIGPRICIGLTLAMLELTIGLAEVFRAVTLSHLGQPDPEPVLRITLQASTPVKMLVTRRMDQTLALESETQS